MSRPIIRKKPILRLCTDEDPFPSITSDEVDI